MVQKTNGIVLRSVKYGDTSLVTTIFTEASGLQAYMVQGVRTSAASKNRAAYFQPAMLLDLVVTRQPLKNMHQIREFNAAFIYHSLRQDVVKNSIALFSIEILLRLLPEGAPMPALFDFAYRYFVTLDALPLSKVSNFPLYFIVHCSRQFGFDLKGSYSVETPHLNLREGGFTEQAPSVAPFVSPADANLLSGILKASDYDALELIQMSADTRLRLTDWFITFLQLHTQHMGRVKSLAILRTILH